MCLEEIAESREPSDPSRWSSAPGAVCSSAAMSSDCELMAGQPGFSASGRHYSSVLTRTGAPGWVVDLVSHSFMKDGLLRFQLVLAARFEMSGTMDCFFVRGKLLKHLYFGVKTTQFATDSPLPGSATLL